MPEQLPKEIRDCSPATKLVYRTIEIYEPIRYTDIRESTDITGPSLRKALRELREADLVDRHHGTADGRERYYRLSNPK